MLYLILYFPLMVMLYNVVTSATIILGFIIKNTQIYNHWNILFFRFWDYAIFYHSLTVIIML